MDEQVFYMFMLSSTVDIFLVNTCEALKLITSLHFYCIYHLLFVVLMYFSPWMVICTSNSSLISRNPASIEFIYTNVDNFTSAKNLQGSRIQLLGNISEKINKPRKTLKIQNIFISFRILNI